MSADIVEDSGRCGSVADGGFCRQGSGYCDNATDGGYWVMMLPCPQLSHPLYVSFRVRRVPGASYVGKTITTLTSLPLAARVAVT